MALPLLPLLGNVSIWTWVKIGAVALVAGTVLTLSWRVKSLSAERDSLKVAVDTATAANEAQAKALTDLTNQRAKDAVTIEGLMNDVSRINEKDRANRRTIANLEKTNADVRSFLRIPVPAALQRVLSDEGGDEAGSDQGDASGATPSEVPAAQEQGAGNDVRAH